MTCSPFHLEMSSRRIVMAMLTVVFGAAASHYAGTAGPLLSATTVWGVLMHSMCCVRITWPCGDRVGVGPMNSGTQCFIAILLVFVGCGVRIWARGEDIWVAVLGREVKI